MQREVLGSKSTEMKGWYLLYVIFTDLDNIEMMFSISSVHLEE